MKRLGVKLAGGAGVVLLGVLAAAQAQKDPSTSTAELERELIANQPAAPIAAINEEPWDSESTIYRGNDPAPGVPDAAASPGFPSAAPTNPAEDYPAAAGPATIQLAAHEAPVTESPAADVHPDFPMTSPPDAAAQPVPTGAEMQAGPGLAMPLGEAATSPDAAAASGPAMAFPGSFPGEAPAPTENTAPAAADSASMPELDMSAEAPGSNALTTPNVLRGEVSMQDISAPEAENAAEMSAAAIAPETSAEAPPATVAAPQAATLAAPTAADDSAYQFQAAEMRTVPAMPETDPLAAAAPEAMAPATTMPAAVMAETQPAPPPQANAAFPAAANDPPSLAGNSVPAGGVQSPTAVAFPAQLPAAQPPAAQPAMAPQSTAAPQGFPAAAPQPIAAAQPQAAPAIGRIASRDTTSLPAMENVMGQPGDRRWEGAQAPSVLIHKRAPEEVKVGKPATFVIDVRNVGTTDAYNVQVHDKVPDGMRLVDAMPQPTGTADALTWSLGGLEPGGERSITMQLIPETEGELGSVARVTFEAAASVRTIATRPELRIRQRAPERVLIGQQLELEISIENVGTGTATGVVLQEDVPEGLEHPKGRQLDNLLGDLGPGETRTQILRLRATAAGNVQNVVRLISDDNLSAEDAVAVEVVAPQIALELQGPSKRFLERPATYNIALANTGTANATNVELVAYLDRGFSFVSTEHEGQYDPSRHAIYWSLAELPTGANGTVPLTLLPVEEGEQAVRLEVTGDLGVREKNEKLVLIDTLAELSFSVADDQDPVETGSETTYEIRVTNSGSRGDTNVQLKVQLPPQLELVSADRNAGTDGRGLVAFEPLPRLTSQHEEVYRLRVRGNTPGTHKIQAILTSDQSTVPVTKEESTTVYSDQ
ncbi:DUF11 domain-containing protein [Roseimaritima ulvae]|uniref:Large cysteine-rich periplasmic protein omcB n=1 Tax=Roseimaritima ulvae TaxID=980254 RepID=A0A5B9QSU2_9BACT|nr:DUF11 domain-containing protein [Roseimaritima ulvae]QEG42187.1 Large cysteine-rich periplasmic protein omcB precursor [Roseimaritima ulvae]